MSLVIRPFSEGDAEEFIEVHHAAIRETASKDYPVPVIDAWAPPITAEHIKRVQNDRTSTKIIAVQHGEIVGIGETAPASGELRACYVSPRHGGQGIGRAIVEKLEDIARSEGALSLWLDSSLTAEAFYKQLGYSPLSEESLPCGLVQKWHASK